MAMGNMASEDVKMKEREISLSDLLVEILLHWRMALVFMLIGGILLGGFSYVRSRERQQAMEVRQQAAEARLRAVETQLRTLEKQWDLSLEERMEQWEARGIFLSDELDDTQFKRIYAVLELKRHYEKWIEYQQHSYLMQMDPLNVQQADLSFVVRAEDADCAYGAENAYVRLLTSTLFYEYAGERCGLREGVNELISLSRSSSSIPQSSIIVLDVQILYDDADTCSALADAVEEFIQQQQKELEQTIGSHEITCISRSQGKVLGKTVAESQNAYASVLYSLSNYYSTLLRNFDDKERAYYDYLLAGSPADTPVDSAEPEVPEDGDSAEEPRAVTAATKAKVSVEYVLFGAVLFVCIFAFVFFMKYIMNSRLRSTDSLCDLYGIPQLGMVSALCPKRFLGVVDQWILKLRYHNQRRFTPEESVGLAAVAVKMAARKKGTESVCLLGCELKGNTLEICGQIKEQLEAAGLEVNTLSNVLYDAEAMEKLGRVGSVVLVETAGVTLYDEILKELELLQRQEITVLGGIVAE